MTFLEPDIEREQRDLRQQRRTRQTKQRQATRRQSRREILNKQKSPTRLPSHGQVKRGQQWSRKDSNNQRHDAGSRVAEEGGLRCNLQDNDLRRCLPSCKY